MEIRVSGHQIDTGSALQTHVTERMNAIADKYFSRAISAHATFGRGPHEALTCDIVSHVMQGVVLKGHGQARDAHVAFESAADRIEKQLRRYMRRLKDKGAGNAARQAFDSTRDRPAGAASRNAGHLRPRLAALPQPRRPAGTGAGAAWCVVRGARPCGGAPF